MRVPLGIVLAACMATAFVACGKKSESDLKLAEMDSVIQQPVTEEEQHAAQDQQEQQPESVVEVLESQDVDQADPVLSAERVVEIARAAGFDPDNPDGFVPSLDPASLDIREVGAGFEWIPGNREEGESLRVVLPADLDGIRSCAVAVLGPDEWIMIEEGTLATGEGSRSSFVFSRPGADYPPYLHVVVDTETGSEMAWLIRGSDLTHR